MRKSLREEVSSNYINMYMLKAEEDVLFSLQRES